jgi:hypothetical protein
MARLVLAVTWPVVAVAGLVLAVAWPVVALGWLYQLWGQEAGATL